MTGTILIILGVITTGIGIVLLIKSPNSDKKSENDKAQDDKTVQSKEDVNQLNNEQEISNLIDLAVADGVITDNEKEIIIKKALEFGMDTAKVEKELFNKLEKTKENAETVLIGDAKAQELKNMIIIAAADGVITKNEKEIILRKAVESKISTTIVEKLLSEEIKKTNGKAETILIGEAKERELKNLIKLAVVDGVLTDNEREIILNKSIELGVNTGDIEELLREELAKYSNDAETKLIDKKKERGDLFEAYIAAKFDKTYFKLKEWAGDKYSKGIYAETTMYPDLKLSFKLREIEQEFAVECKYRTHYYQNGINWATENQLTNYKKYEEKFKIPVFVAIGIEGNPKEPLDLFIIPLKKIEHTFLSKNMLEKHRKDKSQNFFFNHKELKLS